MPLTSDARIGHFDIGPSLGAGGMGEVYQAHDTTLGRDVALKVLPATFAHDPERLARFEREARLLASLNHPNIAAIHNFERVGDQSVLVMELVAGPTLADRLTRTSAIGRQPSAISHQPSAISHQPSAICRASHRRSPVHCAADR